VLYPDPLAGYPPQYARDSVPAVTAYPDGFPVPLMEGVSAGTLLGCVSGELGLRHFLESRGHTLVVTSDKCACASAAALAMRFVRFTTARADARTQGRAELRAGEGAA
jgi:formate dehydrogenase